VHKNTSDPGLYKCYEVGALLPGPGQLTLEMWQHNALLSDVMIGSTTIDLEDRWFSHRWQALGQANQTTKRYAPKPVEMRPLMTPLSSVPQGTLKLWVDIMTMPETSLYPMVCVCARARTYCPSSELAHLSNYLLRPR